MSQGRVGRCRCGEVRFELDGPPVVTMACHCTGCQRMTSSAYSLSELHRSGAFRLSAGEPVLGGLKAETKHYFCPSCMSWLFTRPAGLEKFVNVRAPMMEDAHAFTPFIESYTKEMLPWASTGAEHSFVEFPTEAEFAKAMVAYAAL